MQEPQSSDLLVVTPDLRGLQGSVQGQNLAPVVGAHNVPDLPFCQVAIVMEPGKVTRPHIHDEIHVAVTLTECDPTGVLTLYGDRFQYAQWLYQGQTLYIPPGVKHMAIRPRPEGPRPRVPAPLAYACETRSTGDWRHDVRHLPQDWHNVADQLWLMNLVHRVEWPAEAADVVRLGR
jgi:uncharacterized RmlC-like cupin family protein